MNSTCMHYMRASGSGGSSPRRCLHTSRSYGLGWGRSRCRHLCTGRWRQPLRGAPPGHRCAPSSSTGCHCPEAPLQTAPLHLSCSSTAGSNATCTPLHIGQRSFVCQQVLRAVHRTPPRAICPFAACGPQFDDPWNGGTLLVSSSTRLAACRTRSVKRGEAGGPVGTHLGTYRTWAASWPAHRPL